MKTTDKLNKEWTAVHANARATQPLVEPSDEEKRNGWTAETLTEYLAERSAAASLKNDKQSLHSKMGGRPSRQNKRPSGNGLLRWMR